MVRSMACLIRNWHVRSTDHPSFPHAHARVMCDPADVPHTHPFHRSNQESPMSFTRLLLITPALMALLSLSVLPAADDKSGAPDAKAMELIKPGPEHQQLAKLVGTWDVACKMWMQPDAPPVDSKGSETFTTVFEGRFLQAKFEGSMMGQPFTGYSTMGYDRSAKRYVTTWHDSISTGLM